MFDVTAICEVGERVQDVTFVRMVPSVMYPAIIERIQEALSENVLPEELIDLAPADPTIDERKAARDYFVRARNVPDEAWGFALRDRDGFDDQQEIAARAEALECARLWFTRALKNALGPVHIYIERDEQYRL